MAIYIAHLIKIGNSQILVCCIRVFAKINLNKTEQ